MDSCYRGDIGLVVRNVGKHAYTIEKGERIAQGVVAPVICADITEVEALAESDRGEKGYGSTGKN